MRKGIINIIQITVSYNIKIKVVYWWMKVQQPFHEDFFSCLAATTSVLSRIITTASMTSVPPVTEGKLGLQSVVLIINLCNQ